MDQTTPDPAQIQHIVATMVPIFGIIFLLVYALIIVPLWFAFKKAGLSPWLSLLTLVPLVGFLLPLYVLAFARWRVIPMPAEYPAYPPTHYVQAEYPQQHLPAAYPPPPAAYPAQPQASVYPPPDPSNKP